MMLFVLPFIGILSGCASLPFFSQADAEVAMPAEAAVQVTAMQAELALPSAEFIKALAAARSALLQLPGYMPQSHQWRAQLALAQAYADRGLSLEAVRLAHQAESALLALSRHYYRAQATDYYRQVQRFARLSGQQIDDVHAAEWALAQENYKTAFELLQPLLRKLYTSQLWVVAKPGDSLGRLSARRDIYDNPHLWPLLWRSNKGLLRHPQDLSPGHRLRVQLHPQIDDIIAAAVLARDYADQERDDLALRGFMRP